MSDVPDIATPVRTQAIMNQFGINTKKSLGQNFLTIKHHSLGIEYASADDIRQALSKVYTASDVDMTSDITRSDLVRYGLMAGANAAQRREHVSERLGLGYEADTIETNGSALSEATLQAIQRAAKSRGIIVFTDPDFNGERLRKLITAVVPDTKHAFLTKDEAGRQW
ncbi:DUF4093 domain-containing protein [Weissella confusa]|uniref:DUF4093 domain-containing protein n=1 Tax=Weissella confusa TaxID=1583 RepID=A0A923NIS1_WEICO|nr:DUF4093 domain-containing protein [Weissella confusa]